MGFYVDDVRGEQLSDIAAGHNGVMNICFPLQFEQTGCHHGAVAYTHGGGDGVLSIELLRVRIGAERLDIGQGRSGERQAFQAGAHAW